MQNNGLIFIGIPTLDVIKTETVASLFAATSRIEAPAKLNIFTSSYIHDARNKIVDAALEAKATHLIFIDSDMQFSPDSIQKLVERDKDIVGGLYFRRQAPHNPIINQKDGKRLVIPPVWPKNDLFEVFGIGTGFLMIKMKVFEKIPPPWFAFSNLWDKPIGEDIYFCWKAQERGFKVWCDPTLNLGHVGTYVFTKEDYDAYEDVRPKHDVEDLWKGKI